MCGLSGFLDPSCQMGGDELERIAVRMANTLRHRGPDDGGVWADAKAGIVMGHRRLSIIDLSSEGHQPMHSADDRYVIAFNGEIYNFRALRRELEQRGHSFRGHSDTEVMLASISQWGTVSAVKRFVGMFAFALWDRRERVLHLVRDRLGIKPLYYGWVGQTLLFGSELKSLRAHPQFKPHINRDALALYLRHNYIPTPYSIYQGIHKLPPGTVLNIHGDGAKSASAPVPYWSAGEMARHGNREPFSGSTDEAIECLHELLGEAVKLRMVADVPLGAFLSGGVDSSSIVALMQAHSVRPIKTFTIGFSESGYNEAHNAKAVAHHLGTEHTELYVTSEDAMSVIPRLPTIYDEPFSDSSQIPTYLVSELARRHVTVSLSGDGGDELFGGYDRYSIGRDIWRYIGWMPILSRKLLAKTISAVPVKLLNGSLAMLSPAVSKYGRTSGVGDKLHRLSEIMAVDSPEALYLRLLSHWKHPASMVPGASEPPTPFTDTSKLSDLPDLSEKMMYLDTVTYLPDDILTKVDRASMSMSLEARVPFLDHRVVEFVWRLPLSTRLHNGQTKWALRQVLHRYVPPDLITRNKMGFGVPIGVWLRGPLRDWADSLLNERRLKREGFFHPQSIVDKWSEHLSGTRDWHYHLWDILMFQAWQETQDQTN